MRAFLAFLFLVVPLIAADDPRIAKGFDHFYNLEYDEAIAEFSKALADDPKDANRHNHLAQAILYRAMYRAGALESELVTGNNPFLRREKVNPSPQDEQRFNQAIDTSLKLSEERLQKNPDDVQALYTKGVAYGLRANYNFLVRKAWMDSLRDATKARKAHNRVVELDPKYIDARLVQGVHDYVVGSLPWSFKMLGFLVGFRGDREAGIETLKLVGREGNRNKIDAQILLSVIYRREKRPADAIPLVSGMVQRFPRNYLLRFELAQMYSDNGQKTAALETLNKIEELKRAAAPGYQRVMYEKICYARGNLLFWYNDLDGALKNLQCATAKADELDLNTGVLAWMRLGQVYDLKGQRSQAQAAYRSAIAYAPNSDAAKESNRYLSSAYRREKRS